MLDHGDQILDAAFPKEINDALDLDDHAIKLRKIWLQSFHATLEAGAIGGCPPDNRGRRDTVTPK